MAATTRPNALFMAIPEGPRRVAVTDQRTCPLTVQWICPSCFSPLDLGVELRARLDPAPGVGRGWQGRGGGGARWLGARLDPSVVERSELDGLERCRGGRELTPAVPHDEPPVESDMELDPLPGAAAAVLPGRHLQDHGPRPDRAVTGDGAPVLEAADPLDRCATGHPPPGRLGLGGVHRGAAVVPHEVARQERVGAVAVIDDRDPQLRDEPVPERAPEAVS